MDDQTVDRGRLVSSLPTRNWNLDLFGLGGGIGGVSSLPTRNWNQFNTAKGKGKGKVSSLPTRNWNTISCKVIISM